MGSLKQETIEYRFKFIIKYIAIKNRLSLLD